MNLIPHPERLKEEILNYELVLFFKLYIFSLVLLCRCGFTLFDIRGRKILCWLALAVNLKHSLII